jgi:hypothetical protein
MTPIIAIDPGAKGGFAYRDYDGNIALYAMPKTEGDVCDLLREIKANSGDLVAIIEQVGGYAGGAGAPGSAMFNFGMGYGLIRGILMAWSVPVDKVIPQTWQKVLGIGTRGKLSAAQWKRKLKGKAQELHPGLHGLTLYTCDALLILDYKIGKT